MYSRHIDLPNFRSKLAQAEVAVPTRRQAQIESPEPRRFEPMTAPNPRVDRIERPCGGVGLATKPDDINLFHGMVFLLLGHALDDPMNSDCSSLGSASGQAVPTATGPSAVVHG